MKQIRYQVKEAFMCAALSLSDSYITHVELQGDAISLTFAKGIMACTDTPTSEAERTGEAVCQIALESIDDVRCYRRKQRYLFHQLLHIGREINIRRLAHEINTGKFRLEIVREYYYFHHLFWQCSCKRAKHRHYDEVTISMGGLKQFELTWRERDA